MEKERDESSLPAIDFHESEEFLEFRSLVALRQVTVGFSDEWTWSCYDHGPKDLPPVVFLPGVSGTANVFYRQSLYLAPKGHRVISTSPPAYDSLDELVDGFLDFLEALQLKQVHLVGVSFGGFLAQAIAEMYPEVVLSLVLVNSFCDTQYYADNAPCRSLFGLMPAFALRRAIVKSFPDIPMTPVEVAALDFMIDELDTLSRKDLYSRLRMNTTSRRIGELRISENIITIIESLDDVVIPRSLKDELVAKYPNARYAPIKTGGAFPFLANADELTLMIEVHIRSIERLMFPEEYENAVRVASERAVANEQEQSLSSESSS